MQMQSQPLFVSTVNKEWINLSLVRQIRIEPNRVLFSFDESGENPDWVSVPVEEGKRIIHGLQSYRPDLFLAA